MSIPHARVAAGAALLLVATTIGGQVPAASAQQHDGRTVLSTGHVDAMSVHLENGRLGLRVKDDTGDSPVFRDPSDVLFQVLPGAEMAIPSGDSWTFLGDAGDPIWLLPLNQDHSLLWPGWSTEPLDRGQFTNDQLSMRLVDVEGPGEVVLWTVNNFGEPIVTFNSRDGLPDDQPVLVPAHVHSNWAFTAPGAYTLTWRFSGTLSDGTSVTTGPVEYRWHVGDLDEEPDPDPPGEIDLDGRLVLHEGHVDVLSTHLSGGELSLQVKDDTRLHAEGAVFRDPDDVAFHAVPESRIVLGDEAATPPWNRLGDPGDSRWLLPDVDKPGLLFPGWSTQTILDGQLAGDTVTLSMVDFTGPGELIVSTLDDFGTPGFLWDTRDPFPQGVDTRTRTHAHANWYFTEPGVYGVTWRAEAELADGTPVASEPRQFVFVVDEWPDDGGGDPPPPPENAQVITATIGADAGSLILSIDPNDRNVDLPPAQLSDDASRWSTSGGLRPVTVTDTRTADPGWTASGQVGEFTSSNGSFTGAHLGWEPRIRSSGDGQRVQVGPTVNGELDGGPGLAASKTLASTAAGSGTGTAVLGARLHLTLPTDVEAGTYTALITFTAI